MKKAMAGGAGGSFEGEFIVRGEGRDVDLFGEEVGAEEVVQEGFVTIGFVTA